ncbi:MAG: hypothetical protein AAF297_00135 [Planctomycetota bacterium]
MPITASQPDATPTRAGTPATATPPAQAAERAGDIRLAPHRPIPGGWITGWVAAAVFAALLRGLALYTPVIAEEIATPGPRPTAQPAIAQPAIDQPAMAEMPPGAHTTDQSNTVRFFEIRGNDIDQPHPLLIRDASTVTIDHTEQSTSSDEHGTAHGLRTMEDIAAWLVTTS